MTLVSTVGGASGPLYGTFFLRMASSAGDGASLDPTQFAAALRAGLDGVVARGRAQAGDKTMYDALAPACDALDTLWPKVRDWTQRWSGPPTAAQQGRDATIAMLARKGRASYLGERSVGHQDPGATSAAMLVSAARVLAGGFVVTGLVVVSHSRALAEAAVALAAEMVHGSQLRIAVAAGLDATTFGTDATAIVEAITEADDGNGVVVLMDLGSAVLSAEMALDMIDPAVRDRVVLCPAPLVEGLVVAAVAAAGGANPAAVAAEAMGSLAAKQSHLDTPRPSPADADRGQTRHDERGRRAPKRPPDVSGREDQQPARSARPTGRPSGPGSPALRRAHPAAQPRHGSRARPGHQPVPSGHARSAARPPGRGDRRRQPGA